MKRVAKIGANVPPIAEGVNAMELSGCTQITKRTQSVISNDKSYAFGYGMLAEVIFKQLIYL